MNTNTVQLLAGPSNTPVNAAVAYSPTTNSIYLTPEAILKPGTVYTVRVSQSTTGDQGFPNPGYPPHATFTTTFQVAPGPLKHETSPLTVLTTAGMHPAISPGYGVRSTSFGYASISFSEPIAKALLGRYSVTLTLQAGGLSNSAFDAGDPPLNARLAFNPNTDQLIVVPTVLTGDGIYMISLSHIRGADGSLLTSSTGSATVYASFQVKANGKPIAVRARTTAHETVTTVPALASAEAVSGAARAVSSVAYRPGWLGRTRTSIVVPARPAQRLLARRRGFPVEV